jgi:hypothetical protein
MPLNKIAHRDFSVTVGYFFTYYKPYSYILDKSCGGFRAPEPDTEAVNYTSGNSEIIGHR